MVIPFFAFRIMVGCGLLMLGLAWVGTLSELQAPPRAYNRPLLWLTFLSFPLPFVAILTGWFTAEVGRQPWVVYGVLRTADAMTPFLTTRDGDDLARRLLRGLRLHLRVRHLLHLPAAPHRPRADSRSRFRISRCPTGRCRWPTRNSFQSPATLVAGE